MRSTYLLVAIAMAVATGCASKSDPVQGPREALFQARLQEHSGIVPGNHHLWGYYDLYFDVQNNAVQVVPDREAFGHFNVLSLVQPPKCADCLKLKILSHDKPGKTLFTEVTLKNPTQITGYEVRGIALPKVPGIQLLNAEGYTDLWNKGAYSVHNPFHIFSTTDYLHPFASGGTDKQEYNIHYTDIGSLGQIGLALDVSWPDAVEEPYRIDPPVSKPIFSGSGQVNIGLAVYDWQSNVEYVHLYPFPLAMSGAGQYVDMSHGSGNTWSVSVSNINHIAEGEYQMWACAKSLNSDIALWQAFAVTVQNQSAEVAQVDVRYYVAMDVDGFLPYHEDPGGGITDFTLNIAKTQRAHATAFWTQYGFKLVDNSAFTTMNEGINDSDYYMIDSVTEALDMHAKYGKSYAPGAMSVYFVQSMVGLDTAAAVWPHSVTNLGAHSSQDVFIIFTPNVWSEETVLAHEGGHAFGALEDVYLLDPPTFMCADLEASRPPWFNYLYCDDTAYYEGNLMWYSISGWTINQYNLTKGQANFVKEFQNNFPGNW